MRLIKYIVLHHSAVDNEKDQFQIVNEYHKKRWGRGIEYHFFIERDGTIKSGMPIESIGYHAGKWSMNVQSIGICLAGDFTHNNPRKTQQDALLHIVTSLQKQYGIPDTNVLLHKEVKPTECPGMNLRRFLVIQEPVIVNISREPLKESVLQRLLKRLRKLGS